MTIKDFSAQWHNFFIIFLRLRLSLACELKKYKERKNVPFWRSLHHQGETCWQWRWTLRRKEKNFPLINSHSIRLHEEVLSPPWQKIVLHCTVWLLRVPYWSTDSSIQSNKLKKQLVFCHSKKAIHFISMAALCVTCLAPPWWPRRLLTPLSQERPLLEWQGAGLCVWLCAFKR